MAGRGPAVEHTHSTAEGHVPRPLQVLSAFAVLTVTAGFSIPALGNGVRVAALAVLVAGPPQYRPQLRARDRQVILVRLDPSRGEPPIFRPRA